MGKEQPEMPGATSSKPTGSQAKSTGTWIAKVSAVLALVVVAWATIGSSWYFGSKAQICSAAGRAFSTPDMPCYRPRPGCEQASDPLSISPACVDETYRGEHRYFGDDFVSRAFEWMSDQLDFYITPAWNAFFISDINRKAVFGVLVAVAGFVLKKLGEDVWEYLKASHRG